MIIVGTGRCGSTMLHRLLALHEELGWLSPYNEVMPAQRWLSSLSNLYRLRLPDRIRHAKAFPKPFESYRFWEAHLPGFSRRNSPLTADDVPGEGIEPVRRAVDQVLRYQRRERLLAKVTGWSRIAYFDRIFPGTRFIWLDREPRAVVSSWARAGWLDVTSPPTSENWQWGEVPPPYLELWHQLGGGPILSAALKIRLDLDDIERNRGRCPDRCLRIRYEDVIMSPIPTIRSICEFSGLGWSDRFESRVGSIEFYDPTGKWRSHLSEQEGEAVVEFFHRSERLPAGAG